jgi:CHASE2 domain-containing sensor protein
MTELGFWKRIKEEMTILRVGALPGTVVIMLAVLLRLTGAMQSIEWLTFDTFLSLRPLEPMDERITIVGINQDDIRRVGTYPLPDREIVLLLKKLQSLQPRAIGIDIFRDLPIEPGYDELVSIVKKSQNLICVEKVLSDKIGSLSRLPTQKVSFADQVTDNDGKLRRSLLLVSTPQEYKKSLSISLAKAYLAYEGVSLKTDMSHRTPIKLGTTKLPRFFSNSGGYIRADVKGVQILLNFRNSQESFRTLTLSDIKTGNFNPNWIRDRIVIIGMIAPSIKDFIMTSAIPSTKPGPGQVHEVEIQAHAVSQIISAGLDSRPLLNTWLDGWEYLWIIGWGLLGISFARLIKSPYINFLAVCIASTSLIFISYWLLVWGWWVPVVPAMLVLLFNGIGLTALYQDDRALQSKLYARQVIIERTFATIHNGPLQTLAETLRFIRDRSLPINELLPFLEEELEKVNYELRGIYDFLQREPLNQDNILYLGRGLELNLQDPLHEILYQVYSHTLEREFTGFKNLQLTVRKFNPIDDRHLSIEQKQGLCRFLEEALCNVGKHALGATHLEVICTKKQGWYILSVLDNGLGLNSSQEHRGTQQFMNLAKQLKGKYRRETVSPQGTLCELSWPVAKFLFW